MTTYIWNKFSDVPACNFGESSNQCQGILHKFVHDMNDMHAFCCDYHLSFVDRSRWKEISEVEESLRELIKKRIKYFLLCSSFSILICFAAIVFLFGFEKRIFFIEVPIFTGSSILLSALITFVGKVFDNE